MERLNIALIHLAVRHGEPEHNRRELIRLNRQAAEGGARIIVNTELAVSGYSFRSPQEVAAIAEPVDGPSVRAMAAIAEAAGCYIVLGYAEIDQGTGICYNAAAVLGPDGKLALNYRKVTAEARWACPGSHVQANTFETPWGTAAVLICSDTYYGLIPRRAALSGADLLLVPANWPGGSLDPRELWRGRARENGCSVVACNRTGKDRTMECYDAVSCVYGSDGSVIAECSSPDSEVFHVELPLSGGKLHSSSRERFALRTPERYRSIYLDMRYATDMTNWHGLPTPAPVQVRCLHDVSTEPGDVSVLDSLLQCRERVSGLVVVLPLLRVADREEATGVLLEAARMHGAVFCSGLVDPDEVTELICCRPDGSVHRRIPERDGFVLIDLDHLRLTLLSPEECHHPEAVTALAKEGCDLVVAPATGFDEADRAVLGSRSIEQVAVAACGRDVSFICLPPVDHYRWEEAVGEGVDGASMLIDVEKLRRKHFFERIDAELLLSRNGRSHDACRVDESAKREEGRP
ncbi:MAG: carbon-nitrogen hydrolase [Chlorobiaceae bacterium]|nr:carbon-nitrogen hydrolase [Chlorobiaceae bacterium]